MTHATTRPVERSIGTVMGDVAGNVERLVRTEVALTKATLLQDLRGMMRGSALLASGAAVGVLAVLFLLQGAVARLSEVMKVWQASLLVAGGTAFGALLLIGIGIGALRSPAAHRDAGAGGLHDNRR